MWRLRPDICQALNTRKRGCYSLGVREKLAKEPPLVISSKSPILDDIPAVATRDVGTRWQKRQKRKGIKAREVKRMRSKQDEDQEDQRG